jgi:multidrug efflux pump subunit AcrA (membrane-fusion protein)
MSEAGVSKEQLEKGNEPAFGPTIQARSTAEKHEAKAEAQYRKSEAQVQGRARAAAQNELAEGLGGMHGTRQGQIGKVVIQQGATFAKDALERKRVTDTIAGIKEKTKTDVKAILDAMDAEAVRIFDEGLAAAEKLYGQVFEDAKGGAWTWVTTWGDDWEELIEKSLGKARQAYLDRVDVAIDAVADYVDQQIEASKNRVTAGLTEVQTFVAGLEGEVQKFGTEALEEAKPDPKMVRFNDEIEPLVRLVDTTRCYFIGQVEGKSAAALHLDQSMKIEVDGAATPVIGKISFISPVVDPASGLAKVKAIFENADAKIRPGLAARMTPH